MARAMSMASCAASRMAASLHSVIVSIVTGCDDWVSEFIRSPRLTSNQEETLWLKHPKLPGVFQGLMLQDTVPSPPVRVGDW